MGGQLGELVVSLSADLARFREDMGKANKIAQDTMSRMHSDITGGVDKAKQAFQMLSSVAGTAMAVVAGGAIAKGFIDTTKEVTGEVVKLTKVFGVNAYEASVLRIALDDAFLTVDDAVGASDRLTRASIKNSDAFKKAGIDIKDSNGRLKDSMTVMMEVNDYLKTLKEGKDRDTAAMMLYGKGWRELSGILRLNSDSMKDAKVRAEELHLIIGPQGIETTKKYKSAMKDLGDVAESFKVRAGSELIPILTKIAVEMERIALAGSKLPKTLDDRLLSDQMHEAVGFWEKLQQLQRMGLRSGMGQFLPESERQKVYDETKQSSVDPQMARLAYDKKNRLTAADGRAPDTEIGPKSDWHAAHAKYVEYLKAFAERELSQQKVANEIEAEENRQSYALGLKDLDTYLTKKNALLKSSLDAEVKAKTKELLAAQTELQNLQPVLDSKGKRNPSKEAENRHEALKKEEDAQKALAEAIGKRTLETDKAKDSDREAFYTTTRGYQEQQAALADYQQDYIRAAAIRRVLEEQAHARKQLEINAAAGDLEAEKALTAARIIDIGKVQQAIAAARLKEQNNISEPAHRLQSAIGGDNYGSKFGLADEDYQKEITGLKSQYDAKVILEEEFQTKMLQAKRQFAMEQNSIGLSMAADSLGIMRQAFSDNKAMSIIALAAEAAIAVDRIMMNAEVAKSAAVASLAMLGPFSPAMEAAATARITAGEMMSIGLVMGAATVSAVKIAGGRAAGGPVRGGETYLVGEKGPELFTAGTSGNITPNNQLGGGGIVVNATIDARGADQGVEQKIRAGMQQAVEAAYSKVKRSMDRGGEMALASGRMR